MTQTETGKVTQIRFEHLYEFLGIGTDQPRLTWLAETRAPGWQQAAYEIEAYTAGGCTQEWQLWAQTGRVNSSESAWVAWPFTPLASRQRVAVRVRVWGADGQPLGWSELTPVEVGLLIPEDWSARFITPAWDPEPMPNRPAPLLRREFELKAGEIRRARLYITAHGLYEAQINGQVVGDQVMAPGWTSYKHRLRYQTYDVTGLLRPGRNAIGAVLGDGWFRGGLGFGGARANVYGERVALLAQLEIVYADGTTERIITDETWRAATGPVVQDDIYNGETYDARLEKVANAMSWTEPDYNDSDWSGVQIKDWDLRTLFAPMGPPVRRTQQVAPVTIFKSPAGKTLVDFGQNLVGRLRIKVQGPAGQVITLRHAEVLENGELGIRPLRHARATDRYILKGSGVETWEPRFTFHGFRYAEVEGWPGELTTNDLVAVVCHSDMTRTGWFECSDPLINRLHENAIWSMRGNFLDIPTDCPQRDERLGWTGDIQVFSPTASFLYDSAGFLASWLRDLAAEQKEYGAVPFVVPNVLPGPTRPTAAWGDSAVFIPWVLYQRFGDRQILADQFESMRAWVDLLEQVAGPSRLWDTGFQFGDWLDPAAPPENPGKARTPGFLIATAYFARSAELVGQTAGLLGQAPEQEHYLKLVREVRAAFNREYVTQSGRLLSDHTTAYGLALQFDLLPTEEQRQHAGQRLAALVRGSGYHISTGFVGTPLICDALCSVGDEGAAFRLLTTRDNPSWLYPVTMGATTIWERWDSLLPDGSVNPGEMTSFNHYALGAVADWLHRTLGGLAPAAPGYRRLEIHPRPGGGLTYAQTRHMTPYGMAACAWKIENDQITVQVEVPPNTTARVTLPGAPQAQPGEIGAGQYRWVYPYPQPQAKKAALTVHSTIGAFLDDNEARPMLTQVISRHAGELIEGLLAEEDRPLSDAVSFLPQGQAILDKVAEKLATIKQ